MGVLVITAIGNLIYFLIVYGYLPPPFFHDIDDTFMDWYNTVIWVYRPGAYNIWLTPYPPLSFVFLRFFSEGHCYADIGRTARDCDPIGFFAMAAFMVINLIVSFLIFRKNDPRTALPRALAIGVGTPMLFAWERGNLILPCLTFFMLGHGRLLRSGWVRWLCVAISVNFKPYLLLPIIGGVLHRRWRWAEGCGVAIVAVYVVTLTLFGQGFPGELIGNLTAFEEGVWRPPSLDSIAYGSTFSPLLDFLKSPYPIMKYLGSWPMDTMEALFPLATKVGQLGVLACFAGAVLRPRAVPVHRLAALSMALFMTTTDAGIYAAVFLFFLVFLERWTGPGQAVALIATFILCIPYDYQFLGIAHSLKYSYLTKRTVGYDLGLTVGSFARPTLMVIIEYGLVVASLSDLIIKPLADRKAARNSLGWGPTLGAEPSSQGSLARSGSEG
jgi:hypothetical protein